MRKKSKLVYGIGVNDADYAVSPLAGRSQLRCHFYSTWKQMITRCYSKKYQARKPTYIGCSVCSDWLIFSSFKRWMISQDWQGKELDKDLLITGNKVYSPSTCVFIDATVNNFILDQASARGDCMLGVNFDRQSGKFRAQCCNPFTKKHKNIGRFKSEIDAHIAWKKQKHEFALELSKTQSDSRVVFALENRYK